MAEGAILVGVTLAGGTAEETDRSLDELERLADSAGARVLARVRQQRRTLNRATYVGPGKLETLAAQVDALGADVVVFDDELKPSQQRNIEAALKTKVLDRTQLILDVFAARASTNEGRLQVELAQLTYLLPRLTGMGKALSRLGGGIGTRGPGESKLESDRRRLRDKMAQLGREVEQVTRTRSLQRSRRRQTRAKMAALAGYTNAGKSSLFNVLTRSDVYAADRLFATLDPTVRPLPVEGHSSAQDLLLVDTVGFVRKLPHALVASFRATLEEVAEADVVLRVVDASETDWKRRLESVDSVLDELFERYGSAQRRAPRWLVFNKCDLLSPGKLRTLKLMAPEAHFVSAVSAAGLEALKGSIRDHFEEDLKVQQYLIPHARLGELSRHLTRLRIRKQEWRADGLRLEAVLSQPLPLLDAFKVRSARRRA